jgi:hypothetical protein
MPFKVIRIKRSILNQFRVIKIKAPGSSGSPLPVKRRQKNRRSWAVVVLVSVSDPMVNYAAYRQEGRAAANKATIRNMDSGVRS